MSARKTKGKFQFMDTALLYDEEILLQLADAKPADPAKDLLPTYHFSIILRSTGEMIGRCDLRLGFNESIYYSGNIGYRIFEPFRGHHYAANACALLLKLARLHKMRQVVITCRPDNPASRKTCERLGARFSGIVQLPPSHNLYKEGEREECRYIINFDEFR